MNNGVSYTSTKPLEEFEINKKNKPSDLISRQDAIDAIEKLISARYGWKTDARDEIQGLNAAYCAILGLPSEQKTGKWKLLRKGNDTSDYECTNCLGILMDVANDDSHELQRYCGMCGARMVGEEE